MNTDLRTIPRGKKELFIRAMMLALPMIIQNGITNAVGLVDNMMVGSLGPESMTGVSIAGQLFFVFNLAVFGALSGPGIFGAQFYGNNDIEGVRRVFRIKLWAVFLITLLGIVIFLFDDDLLIGLYMKGSAEKIDPVLTLERSKAYLRIMLAGLLPFSLTQVYSSSLRETNESVLPMIAGLCSVVADILFNYLLIFGKAGFPALGVEGAAIATVIARFIEFGVLITAAHVRRSRYPFLQGVYKTLLVPKSLLVPVVKKGIPILINEFMWASGIAALTQCYSIRGLDVLTALGINNALSNVMNVVFVALGSAVGIIVGQMLGAGELNLARKSAFRLMWFSAGICVFISIAQILIAPFFPLVYNADESIRRMATHIMIITALFFPVQGFLNTEYFTIRSGGKTLVTFLMDSIFTWVVVVATVFVLSRYTNIGVYGIYTISQALDLLKIAFGAFLIYKGVWLNNLSKGVATNG